MKRAVLLHGTDGTPEINWLPWAKDQLLGKGYEVWVPLLPRNHTPNRFVYESFLRSADWDFKDNLLIGHSSGATTILNLLQADWFPTVKKSILVGTFLNERAIKGATWYENGQFDELFPPRFEPHKLREKSPEIVFIHGLDDPYCLYSDALELCDQVEGTMQSVENGLHLSSNRTELPELTHFL